MEKLIKYNAQEGIGSDNFWIQRYERKTAMHAIYNNCATALRTSHAGNPLRERGLGSFTQGLTPKDSIEIFEYSGFLVLEGVPERLERIKKMGLKNLVHYRKMAIETAGLVLGDLLAHRLKNRQKIGELVRTYEEIASMAEREMAQEELMYMIMGLQILPEKDVNPPIRPEIQRTELQLLLELLSIVYNNENFSKLMTPQTQAVKSGSGELLQVRNSINTLFAMFGPTRDYANPRGPNDIETVGDVIAEAVIKARDNKGSDTIYLRKLEKKKVFEGVQ